MSRFSSRESLIKDVTDALTKTGWSYKILSDVEQSELEAWWSSNFPLTSWGRIKWPDILYRVCFQWDEKWLGLIDRFRFICDAENLENAEVVVIWSNALRPSLKCMLNAVRDQAIAIFQADFDIWVVCPEHSWCIEVYHEGEICYGRAN
jgi:hypothetical protein